MSPMNKGGFVIGVHISLVVLDTHTSQPCRASPSLDGKALDSVLCSAESGGIVFLRNKRLQHHGALADIAPSPCWSALWILQAQRGPELASLSLPYPSFPKCVGAEGTFIQHHVSWRVRCSCPCEIKGPRGGLASVDSLRNLGLKNWYPVSNRSIQDEQIIEKVNHRRERNPPGLRW